MMLQSVQKKFKTKTRRLSYFLDTKTPRERLMIFAGIVVAILLLGDRMISNQIDYNGTLSRQKQQINRDIQKIENRIEMVMKGIEIDPLTPLKTRRNDLRAKIAEVSKQYDQLTSNLISPEKMVLLLDELLSQNKGIDLKSIKNLPPKPLRLAASSDGGGTHHFYQHSVEVEFVADYKSTLAYLKTLESIASNVLWNQLDYQVESHPMAHVRMTISTISDKAGWIGA